MALTVTAYTSLHNRAYTVVHIMQPVPAKYVRLPEPCPSACLLCSQEVCEAKLGQSRDRLREYSFEEVQAANAAGNCWLILSGASVCSLACASCPTP